MDVVVISVGGSVIVPDKINTSWLSAFRKLITKHKKRFVIITGGGSTARQYQQSGNEIRKVSREDLDWLGIHATRMNAHLIRTILRDKAHPRIIKNPYEKVVWKEKVLVAAGWKPGWSTDYIAVQLAKRFKSNKVLNLSNIDYVYDKNPKLKGAKKLKRICWKSFRKIVGYTWSPGLNVPFDPIASRDAQKEKLEVAIINGNKLKQVDNYLKGKPFRGTIIGEDFSEEVR